MRVIFGQSSRMTRRVLETGEPVTGASSGDSIVSLSFLWKFGICYIALYAVAVWLPESAFEWLNSNTARMAACCLKVFGIHPILLGDTLSRNGFTVKIITERPALYMGIVFFSFVIAYPTHFRRKVMGFAVGIAMLHTGNILRVAVLFAMGTKMQASFEFVHVYLGQVLTFLFVIAVCLAWLRVWASSAHESGLCSFLIRFVAFSSILFLVLLPLHKEYVRLIDLAVTALFSLYHDGIVLAYQHGIYYRTFNVVTLGGLLLATQLQPLKRKLLVLALGLASVFGIHVLFRVCDALIAAFDNNPAGRLAAGIGAAGQYFLPVLLWLLLVRGKTTAREEEHPGE